MDIIYIKPATKLTYDLQSAINMRGEYPADLGFEGTELNKKIDFKTSIAMAERTPGYDWGNIPACHLLLILYSSIDPKEWRSKITKEQYKEISHWERKNNREMNQFREMTQLDKEQCEGRIHRKGQDKPTVGVPLGTAQAEDEIWNIGKYQSIVVSNHKQRNEFFPTPPNPTESKDEDIEYYGGFLVCESIGTQAAANLISAAPELLKCLIQAVELLEEVPDAWHEAIRKAKGTN